MIGDNIRAIRREFGLTQAEFAEKLGVTSGVITNLEYNRLSEPEKKMPLFRLIEKTFGVPLDWILADDPGPVPMPELDEAQREVAKIGEIVKSEDPFFQAFLRWYGQRTKAERQDICKYVLDFAEKLKEAQK